MDFSQPEELQALIAQVRGLIDADVIPIESEFLRGGFRAIEPRLNEVRARVKRMGLWAPQLPREFGGVGLELTGFAALSEELGRSPLGHYCFNCQAPDSGNLELLLAHGSPEQQQRYAMPLAAGQIRSCFSMTEPDRPGSNPTWLATRAVKDGADYVIDGHKWFTSSAEGAEFAIVMAVTDPDAPRHARASQIIVPLSTPGFRLVRNISVMGDAGDGWASHAEVRYEGVRVPQSNRIGEEGSGFLLAQERLGPGRIHHCMRWIGICERAFDMLCRRAATRELAPGKPLGSRETVQAWIADSRAEIDAARLLVLQTAWRIEHEGLSRARDAISTIKFFVANILQQVLDRAIQAHGALGVTDDTVLAWFFRHERAARIYDGPDEVHRASVAKRILSRYGVG